MKKLSSLHAKIISISGVSAMGYIAATEVGNIAYLVTIFSILYIIGSEK